MAKTPKQPSLPPEPDGDENSTEFDRFMEFSRQILNVPKSEIDKRAIEYNEQPKQAAHNPFANKMMPAPALRVLIHNRRALCLTSPRLARANVPTVAPRPETEPK